MSHLMSSTQRMAENDPTIEKIQKIPCGNWVVYHGRIGSMRQGRTEFPAMVLQQHADDGSLDLIVFFEAEDVIWEQRVREYSEAQPGHCFTHVEPIGARAGDPSKVTIDDLIKRIIGLDKAMYGDFNPPEKAMIEYLDDFDRRLKAVEKNVAKLYGAK